MRLYGVLLISAGTAVASPTLFVRSSNSTDTSNHKSEGDFSSGAIVGTIIGLVCVVALFLFVAYTLFKYRHRKRETARKSKIHLHPASLNAKMDVYSRQQQARIRSSNARSLNSARQSMASSAPRAGSGVGPPPSYTAAVQAPPPAVLR